LLRDVCREFNFPGNGWATLLVGQVTRFDPTEVPRFGTKAKGPSDCLPQQSRGVSTALARAGVPPTIEQLSDALKNLNMLTESEFEKWCKLARLPRD